VKKQKAYTKRQLFREGVRDLALHVKRAVNITRQDHPLKEVQDLCQGVEALMEAAITAADLGYGLEIICAYQPQLPEMEEKPDDNPQSWLTGSPWEEDKPF